MHMTRLRFAGCLTALAAVHDRGIVHGSVGSGSFLASSLDEHARNRLVVKMDNLAFGQLFTGGSATTGLQRGKQADREALAVAFCEFTFGARLRPFSLHLACQCTSTLLADRWARLVVAPDTPSYHF